LAPRAIWKGHIKFDELTCPVALYTAASTSDRVSFHTLNRKTGHRVRRQYVDEDTGKPVEAEEQVKGYDAGRGKFVILEPEEIAQAVPDSDKTLSVETFVTCEDVDTVYFDKPYYVAPSEPSAAKAFAVIREGLRAKGVAALAKSVLFRRVRTVLFRADGPGLVAHTMHFNYEIRPANDVFDEIPDLKIKGEMLDLAKYIIGTKKGEFNPAEFHDRYDAALAELVKAKMEGRKIEAPKARPEGQVVDLMEALRRSAEAGKTAKKTPAKSRKATDDTPARRKAS
jgi:DNA end-binding protein Ku